MGALFSTMALRKTREENCRLRVANAELRAALDLLHALHRPSPFQTLPVEVLTHILSFLEDPRDVFATGRTCARARDAYTHPGAFPYVRISQLDEALDPKRRLTIDLVENDYTNNWRRSAPHFVRFLTSSGAASGIRVLDISIQQCAPFGRVSADADLIYALVKGCSALDRLLGLTSWSVEEGGRIIAGAVATPVAHVVAREAHPPLKLCKRLVSLELRNALHQRHETGGASSEPGMRFASSLEDLLTCPSCILEKLTISGYHRTFPRIQSRTLRTLTFCGKDMKCLQLDCPLLVNIDASSSSGCCYPAIGGGVDGEVWVLHFARAIILGCPLIDWRSSPSPAPPFEDRPFSIDAEKTWPAFIDSFKSACDGRTLALRNNPDAVRFAQWLQLKPIVNGSIQ